MTTLMNLTLVVDWFWHQWGWHYENEQVPGGQRHIALHLGPLLVTVKAPPDRP